MPIDGLTCRIAARLAPFALRDFARVTAYLHCREHDVRQRIITEKGLPLPGRIRSGHSSCESAQSLRCANEVVAWAASGAGKADRFTN
ncbi:hypothetical protein GQ56_0114230 [Burkholderia paludis]|nr:hypothetical protein GQ56_0114230 [Burkholderia paludis]